MFGYVPGAEHEPTDTFDKHMEAVIWQYQSMLSLPIMGQLRLHHAGSDHGPALWR